MQPVQLAAEQPAQDEPTLRLSPPDPLLPTKPDIISSVRLQPHCSQGGATSRSARDLSTSKT